LKPFTKTAVAGVVEYGSIDGVRRSFDPLLSHADLLRSELLGAKMETMSLQRNTWISHCQKVSE